MAFHTPTVKHITVQQNMYKKFSDPLCYEHQFCSTHFCSLVAVKFLGYENLCISGNVNIPQRQLKHCKRNKVE
jgi:hypothetical protein